MFKRVPVETKEEVLSKVKSGQSVSEVAKQYAVSTKTIYTWLQNETRQEILFLNITG